ncbi:MAG: hypothetical protein JW836_15510 [Deltaproteobacteria bacterium]|nr:hypothetical protein [Deltaproteobacteria bacterium]
MKCPKCGYISFDYNLICPKCDRDISSEQEKLNLPSFRPEAPSLLAVFTGERNASRSDLERGSSEIDLTDDAEITFDEDSSNLEANGAALADSGEFESGSEEISLDDPGILELDTGETGADELVRFNADNEELAADLDLGSLDSEKPALDSGELELDVAEPTEGPDKELSLDLGKTLQLKKEISRQTGEISAGKLRLDESFAEEQDDLLDLDEIHLEEIPLEEKLPIDQKADGKKTSSVKENELSLDLGDLDLELDLEDSKPEA